MKKRSEESRLRHIETTRQWQLDNAARHSAYRKEYYAANREKLKEYSKAYSKDNNHRHAATSALRRARTKENGVATCPDEKAEIAALYHEAALLTEITGIEHQVDHIIPIAKGGGHRRYNLQILTKEENLKKSACV